MTQLVGFSTRTADTSGAILIDTVDGGDYQNLVRRAARSATLDGGAHIVNLGFADGDRTFNFTIQEMSQTDLDTLKYIMRNYASVVCSTRDGVFLGTMKLLQPAGSVAIQFMVGSKLSN